MLVTTTQERVCNSAGTVCLRLATQWVHLISKGSGKTIVEWVMCDEHADQFRAFLRSDVIVKSPEWQYLDIEEGAL